MKRCSLQLLARLQRPRQQSPALQLAATVPQNPAFRSCQTMQTVPGDFFEHRIELRIQELLPVHVFEAFFHGIFFLDHGLIKKAVPKPKHAGVSPAYAKRRQHRSGARLGKPSCPPPYARAPGSEPPQRTRLQVGNTTTTPSPRPSPTQRPANPPAWQHSAVHSQEC